MQSDPCGLFAPHSHLYWNACGYFTARNLHSITLPRTM